MAPQLRRIGSANAEFQLAHALLENRRQRRRQRRFVVEGVRPINQAVEHRWPVDSFWYAAGRPHSRWAAALLERGVAGTHVEAAPELFDVLSGKDEPSELLAIVEMPVDDLARVPRRPDALVVVFDRPVGPGNLGSVVRSADALGAHAVVVTGHAADQYDPLAVRASMGSLFAIPVVSEGSLDAVRRWLDGFRTDVPATAVLGSSAAGSLPLWDADLTRPVVLAVGNETKGLSHAWHELCDHLVTIPMSGAADSLNVAAAASVLLYETHRQRARSGAAKRGAARRTA